MRQVRDAGIQFGRQRLVASGRVRPDGGGATQHQRHRHPHRQRGVRAVTWHSLHRAVQPAARQPLFGAAFQIILRVEMAAATVGTGHGVHRQQLAGLIHPMHARERRMQPVKAAQVQHPVRLTRLRRHQRRAQPHQVGVAVRHHGRHPVQRAAQDDDDEPLVGRGRGERDGRRSERPSGSQAEQGGAAGDDHVSASETRVNSATV